VTRGFLPVSALPRPRERDVEQHLPEAGGLDADLDAREAVVLDAQDEGRIGEGASLGDALALGRHLGPGPGVVGAPGERLDDQRRQHRIGRIGSEEGGNGVVTGRGLGELEQDETEERGHGRGLRATR